MHIHYKLDRIFTKGHLWKHRTMRTFFDMHASEWHHTTMDEKLDYLIRAIESGKVTLDEMIQGYKKFYTLEVANKAYVLQSLDKSVAKIKAYALTQGYELK